MNLLSAENLGKSFGDHWLFRHINFGISKGDKFVLVGNNGVGKSTLLNLLSGNMAPDEGEVSYRDGLRIAFLNQQPIVEESMTVNDVLFLSGNDKAQLIHDYELELQQSPGSERMQQLLQRMEEMDAWDYEAKVTEIMGRLGVPALEKPFHELSGGQKKRVFLAKVLLAEPDLLIFDEPTNHLDLEAIEWLENYLNGSQITLIMVTHDRYFLDAVATEIIELDRHQLFRYKGKYAYFLEKKAAREEMLRTEVEKARQLLKKELEWMRRQPKARGTKAKYRVQAIKEIQDKAAQNIRKDKLELNIEESRLGGKILEVTGISKSFDGKCLVKNFSYTFKKKDRIGVIGRNGIGKSTFLDMLCGKLAPDSGEIISGLNTRFGYFTQEVSDLNPEHRIIEEVKAIAEFITLADGTQVSASKFLELFLFPSAKQYTYISKLSGGEKKRIQLLKLLVTNPNFLVLDEPTNDFDVDTLNVLEDFLQQFKGCLLLVSHDRYFMDQLVDQLFVFKGDGSIVPFNGNYSDYRDEMEEQEIEKQMKPLTEKSTPAPPQETRKKLSYQEKEELAKLPDEIDAMERKKAQLIRELNSGELDHNKLSSVAAEVATVDAQIENMTNRWIALSELA